jgi:tetratricopeptide (TPR) repeat protein
LRDSAIADFTAALGFKPDDASLYVERAQDYHLNGQYYLAIADFDAALKLNNRRYQPAAASQRARATTMARRRHTARLPATLGYRPHG